jgi:hypothetical protein
VASLNAYLRLPRLGRNFSMNVSLVRLLRGCVFALLLLPVVLLAAEPVARTAPPLFAEKIAPLLTPLNEILARRDAFPDTREHGIILLDETIHFRGDDGHNYVVYQDAYLARTETASEVMGNRVYSYDREHDSIFLVEAATIQPNGERQSLDDRAAFLQSPQREAEAGLYTSDQELNLIFPNIRPGSVTHMIVVIRENREVFPGEFASRYTFGSGWPTARARVALDFPADYLARIRIVESGGTTPQPAITTSPGRERREWTRESLLETDWEESAPPIRFRAPSLWFSSIDSWDGVATWFSQLVANRGELGPDLEAKLAEWTAGLTERRALVDRLHEIVANEVRYTGLEFGLAGYQPYPCAQVWANRYGDCKDKANLLRALLHAKGIPSHLVLLETNGAGRIERRSPSWKQFNHAILAVEDGRGGYWFCDPTMRHLPAGLLPPGDAAREVLIVREGRAEWQTTPDRLEHGLHYTADLALASNGELSGWFTLSAEGSDAAGYADFYNKFSPPSRLRDLQDRVDDFFPGAEVIDVDFKPVTGSVDRFSVRAYFLRKADDTLDTLNFPFPPDWLPDLSTNGERKFPYAARRRTVSFDATLTLPVGWNAPQLPAPFNADSPAAHFSAAWSAEAATVRTSLKWHPAAAEIPAADYAVFQRSVRSLQAWLKQPARIARSAQVAATTQPATLENFPLLPTGDGQLRLLNERFPSSDGGPTRRAALEQIIQWFPDDLTTIATARIYLALIDAGDNDADLARSLRELLTRYGNTIPTETRGWGRYLQHRAEWWATKSPDALAGLQALAKDPTLSEFRRSWSAHYAALFLGEKDPAAALTYLTDWDILPSEARETTLKTEADLLARAVNPAVTTAWAQRLLAQTASAPDELLAITLKEIVDRRAKLGAPALAHFDTVLTPLLGDDPKLKKSREFLAAIRAVGTAARVRTELTSALDQWAQRSKLPWITRGRAKSPASIEEIEKQLDASNDARNGPATINSALQLLRFHPVPAETYDKYLYWMAWWLERDALAPDLLALIANGSRALPLDNGEFIGDVWLKYAAAENKAGRVDRAREEYRVILNHAASPAYLRLEAAGELALLETQAGRADAARAAFAIVEELHRTHTKGGDYVFASILFHVERDDFATAARLLAALEKISPERREKLVYTDSITVLLRWAADPTTLVNHWKKQAALRQRWTTLLAEHSPSSQRVALPLIADVDSLVKQVTQANAAKNKSAALLEIDQLVRNGWLNPSYLIDAVIQINRLSNLGRELMTDLYPVSLDLLTDFPRTVPESYASALILRAAALFDSGRNAEANELSRDLFRDESMPAAVRSAAVRIWLLAAAQNPTEETLAIEAITTQLAASGSVDDRGDVVASLSDALARRNETVANVGLLAREINHPDIVANADLRKKLTERLESLRRDTLAGTDFTATINTWLKARDLGFLDQMAPSSLEGARYAQHNAAGFYDANVLGEHESIKANLLLARDPRTPMQTRLTALTSVINATAVFALTPKDFAKHFVSIASQPTIPDVARLEILGHGTSFLLLHGHADDAQKMIEAIPDPGQRERFRQYFGAQRAIAQALATYSLENARTALRTAFAQTLTPADATAIKSLLTRMVLAGDAAAAAAEIEAISQLTGRAGSGLTTAGLRLDWGRHLDRLAAQRPFHERVRALFARHVPTQRSDVKTFQKLTSLKYPSSLDQQSRGRVVATIFQENLFTTASPAEVIGALDHATRFNASQRTFNQELDQEIFSAPELDETTRAQWIAANLTHTDFDRADVRASTTALCHALINRSGIPAASPARRLARLKLALMALRASPADRPEELFGQAITTEFDPSMLRRLQFMYHCSRQQVAEADALLALIEPDDLANENLIGHADQLLGGLNRPSERKLLRAAAVEKLRDRLASLWFEPNALALMQLCEAARTIEQPQLIPPALIDHVISHQGDDIERAMGALARALLTADWKAQQKAANAILKFIPDFYEANFYRGEATYQLGDRAAAKADLEVFLQHALNSELRTRAKSML